MASHPEDVFFIVTPVKTSNPIRIRIEYRTKFNRFCLLDKGPHMHKAMFSTCVQCLQNITIKLTLFNSLTAMLYHRTTCYKCQGCLGKIQFPPPPPLLKKNPKELM
jgi:hypothetical protein